MPSDSAPELTDVECALLEDLISRVEALLPPPRISSGTIVRPALVIGAGFSGQGEHVFEPGMPWLLVCACDLDAKIGVYDALSSVSTNDDGRWIGGWTHTNGGFTITVGLDPALLPS